MLINQIVDISQKYQHLKSQVKLQKEAITELDPQLNLTKNVPQQKVRFIPGLSMHVKEKNPKGLIIWAKLG